MVYIMPMVIILASRFFFLCWRYRIPFFYYFGVNAIHIVHGSVFTTNRMIMSHYTLFVMIALIYVYAFSDILLNTCVGRRLFKWWYERTELWSPRLGIKGTFREVLWSSETAERGWICNRLRNGRWRPRQTVWDYPRDDEPDDDIRTSQEGDSTERSYTQKSYQGWRTWSWEFSRRQIKVLQEVES